MHSPHGQPLRSLWENGRSGSVGWGVVFQQMQSPADDPGPHQVRKSALPSPGAGEGKPTVCGLVPRGERGPLESSVPWAWRLGARLCLVALGAAAIAWGAALLPGFVQEAQLERMAAHVKAGDPFKAEILDGLLPTVEAAERIGYCRPGARQAAAVVRLRMVEDAVSAGVRVVIDSSMDALRQSVGRALACAPTDAFLWAVLYWLVVTRNGFRSVDLAYLRLSYRLGPNQGWVALRRNRLALAVYDQLPPDMAEMVVSAFVDLLPSGVYPKTAKVFVRAGWPIGDRLLPRLKPVAKAYRDAFARTTIPVRLRGGGPGRHAARPATVEPA
jgi:hypothetical protein